MLRGSGRLKQTVAESSFDAWVKYYRQDENAPNAIVSYYRRARSSRWLSICRFARKPSNRKSLDDVMRLLWQRFGRDFYHGKPRGIEESEVEAIVRRSDRRGTGQAVRARACTARAICRSTRCSSRSASRLRPISRRTARGKPSLGARVRGGADCVLAAVHEGSAAQKAGLSAGDVLIAIDGLRVTGSNLDTLLSRYLPGAKVEVHAFRRDELRAAQVKLDAPEVSRYMLTAADGRGPAKQWRERWLRG